MRICVYGAGSIGGVIGGVLADAGHNVSLIARGPHLAAGRSPFIPNAVTTRPISGRRITSSLR